MYIMYMCEHVRKIISFEQARIVYIKSLFIRCTRVSMWRHEVTSPCRANASTETSALGADAAPVTRRRDVIAADKRQQLGQLRRVDDSGSGAAATAA